MTDASRVIATDDQAALSKVSCVRLGYWEDEALLKLLPKAKRRSPIINAGYFVRFKVISDIMNKVLNSTRIVQFLILGAGSDTIYWRLNLGKKRPDIKWFEIDFEKNLNYKQSVLEKEYGKSEGYVPVPADLRNIPEMEKKLIANGFDMQKPTFVLSEVVLVRVDRAYLNSEYSTNVIKWVGERINRATFCEFEQINPDSTFGNRMISHFQKMGSPILTIENLRTLSSREKRLKENFTFNQISPVYHLAPSITDIEPFDEFEVLHLYMKHYYVGFGSNDEEAASDLSSYLLKKDFIPGSVPTCKNSLCKEIVRFPGRTFSGYELNNSKIICAGGLGVEDGSSAKENKTTALLEITEDNVKPLTVDSDEVLLPQVITLGEKVLVFGGRKNPKKPNRNLKIFRAGDYEMIYKEESDVFGVYRSAICKVSESSFLCFGGRRSNGDFSNEMYEITVTETDSVSVSSNIIKFDDELPRLASATCVKISDSEFEILGGIKPDGFISSEIFGLKIDGKKGSITWRKNMDFGIYGHSVYINANKMLLIGGISTMHEINDAVIEIERESWKVISIKETSSTELLLVGNGARVKKDTANESEIEIIGGGAHCFAFGNHLNPLISTISF